MKKKAISIFMVAIIAFCFVPGCLGDKIVGKWEGEDTLDVKIKATFNDDNTAKVERGGLFPVSFDNLTWEKEGDEYKIYFKDGTDFGTAKFVDDDLKIVYETGVGINFSGTYKKVKQ